MNISSTGRALDEDSVKAANIMSNIVEALNAQHFTREEAIDVAKAMVVATIQKG